MLWREFEIWYGDNGLHILSRKLVIMIFTYFCSCSWVVGPKLCALMPGHRKISEADLIEIENYITIGIRPPQIYVAFANTSGGYENVRFVRKDLCNQVHRICRGYKLDVEGAFKFFKELYVTDLMLYVSYRLMMITNSNIYFSMTSRAKWNIRYSVMC